MSTASVSAPGSSRRSAGLVRSVGREQRADVRRASRAACSRCATVARRRAPRPDRRPSRRSSSAHTTSPGRSSGETAAHTPAIATAPRVDRERPRRGDARPRRAPCPCAAAARSGWRSIACSTRSGASTSSGCVSAVPEDAAERHHREDVPVQVVVQVEVAREAGARVVRLVPAALGPLRLDQPARPRDRRRARRRRRRRRRAAPTRSATRSTRRGRASAASRYERMSSPKPPSAFCTAVQPLRPRRARPGGRACRRPRARARRRRCRRGGSRPSGRTTSRRAPARAAGSRARARAAALDARPS